MAANNTNAVSAAKPKATGGVLHAPIGTALPTDAATALNAAFVKLGYVGEDGLQPGGERTLEEKRDWAGDVIANIQSGHSASFAFTLLGAFDGDVLKAVFGASNVTVTAATASTGTKFAIVENGAELPKGEWVFEMISGTKVYRIVIPNGQIGTVEELPFVANDLQGFNVTVNAYPDASGNKVYRYLDDGKFA